MSIERIIDQIRTEIALNDKSIAEKISSGFTVTIRPTKDGIKITYHKEKQL